MKKNESGHSDALQHVEPQRREFLAKLIAGGAALPVMSSVALAQGAGKGKGGAGGKGKGEAGKGKGKGGAGKGKGAPGEGVSRPDPAQFAARLMKEFDKDGDQALNLKELTAALTSMRERREGGAGKGKGGAAGKGKGGAAGKGKGKGAGEGGQTAAGVVPKKPGN